MESTPMPEPLRRAIHELVSETLLHCQEVIRYTEPDVANRWRRMTLYRATDAADSMNMAAMLIGAFCEREGMPTTTLRSYLQVKQQHIRADGPKPSDHLEVDGLLGEPAPADGDLEATLRHAWGTRHAESALTPEDDPQKLFAEACLHGLRARLCDDIDSLDSYLPPHIAELARKVAGVLEEPQPTHA
jgi:hypothetical protein